MAPWTTVIRRHKDPGNKEKGQEGQGEEGATMGAHEGVSNRFTGKIRAEFAVSGRIGKFNAVTEAKKLFGQMIRVDEEIVFKSDIDGRITFRKISEFPTGENKFKEFFTVTPHTRNDGTGKIHINFQIESKKRLAFLKRDVTFFNYLRENKIWLVEHKYETHSLQSIGFIVKKSPSITHRPQLETDIGVALNEYMETAIDEGTGNGINLDGRAFIPTMEIVSKHVVHVLRDGNQNRTGVMETHALEIRCERNKAEMLGKLLTAADLPENKFGKFVPYGLAKTDTDVYKKLMKAQNQYMADIVVIPVFGLHKDVLESVTSAHVEGWGEDDSFKNQMMEADSDVKDADSGEIKNEKIFLGIEPTQRTDDLGKWFFLTTKQHEESANKVIDEFLIDVGSTTGAYKNHFNDGDSFMRGIRRANRPSAAFQSYAQALRNDMEDEDDKSDDDKSTNPYQKKRKQIVISFDDNEEFPALPKTKTNKGKQNKQQNTTTTTTTQTGFSPQQKTSANAPQTKNDGIDQWTDKNSTSVGTNAMQAQIDMLKLQITAMQDKEQERWKDIQVKFDNIINHVTSREANDRKLSKRLDDLDKDREREKDMIRRIEHNANKRSEAQEEKIDQISKDNAAILKIISNQYQRQEERDKQQEGILEFVRIQMRTTPSVSKKREASDPLQRISQSMDVDNESVGSTVSQYVNKNQGQVDEGEAEATQLLTYNE